MQFEVNVSDVAGITLQLRSYSQVIHPANVRLPWTPMADRCILEYRISLCGEDHFGPKLGHSFRVARLSNKFENA
jgi:hypothetical protein